VGQGIQDSDCSVTLNQNGESLIEGPLAVIILLRLLLLTITEFRVTLS